jgi:hypothetical protein
MFELVSGVINVFAVYIVASFISEGFENNNSKPFCNYMKSKKQDNIGVAPLKRYGGHTSESREKVAILNN